MGRKSYSPVRVDGVAMNSETDIKQSKLGFYREFRFLDDRLDCKVKDLTGERTFTVPYELIDMPNPSHVRTTNPRYSHRLYRTIVAALVAALLIGLVNKTAGGALSVAALVCYAGIWIAQTAGWFSVDLTHIPLLGAKAGTPAVISLIGDGQQIRLMQELTTRWRDRVRKLFGKANLEAEPQQEISRLQYLRKLDVLSDEEFEAQIFLLTPREQQTPARSKLN